MPCGPGYKINEDGYKNTANIKVYLTTIRPNLIPTLLEACASQKMKTLFLYMAEKAGHSRYRALKLDNINLGTSRFMITPTGKYINKYNMTISKELAEYE